MTSCTPIYMLPFQECSDAPCDADEVWCDFAAVVESNLDRFDAIVDRTVDTVPMAQVRMTIARSQAIGTSRLVPFDTVDVDTDDMVNLAADPFTINLSRQGVWFVYFNVEGTSAGTGNEILAQSTTPTGSSSASAAIQLYLDDGSPLFLSSSGEYRVLSPVPAGTTQYTTTDTRLVLAVGAAAVVTPLTSVTFGAYWLRDLP